MRIADSIALAFRSLLSNKLRAGITITIIAFGIMALIGIITAIKAMNQKFTDGFSTMGANTFTLRFKERRIGFGNAKKEVELSKKNAPKERISNQGKMITREEAEQFVQQFDWNAIKGISLYGNRNNIASYQSRKTNPNIYIFGGDENYLLLNGFQLLYGRNITRQDVQLAGNICLLGYDVAKNLFKGNIEKAVNSIIQINSIDYRVVGVLASRGSTFGFSRDNILVTAYTNTEKNFSRGFSYVIAVMTPDILQTTAAMGEAEGLFRSVRKLSAVEQNNFVADRSNSIAEKAMNSLRFLTLSASIIGLITLIGAAIGLMNIMLVSVSERTREIGLAKAIGSRSKDITRQFLLEAVIISLIGAIAGIILGVLVGNLFALFLQTGFVVPWNWVLYGVMLCSITGLLAGLYPAYKAGKLNPITALRYE
jgi:putative ABC transport system permease protein